MKGTEEAVLPRLVPSEGLVWELGPLLVQLPFGCWKKSLMVLSCSLAPVPG